MGRIGTNRKFDSDLSVVWSGLVKLFKPAPYLTCLNSHHGIVSSCISRGSLKQFCANCSLFELTCMAIKLPRDHKLKELAAARRILEEPTVENALKLLMNEWHLIRCGLTESRRTTNIVVWLDRKTHPDSPVTGERHRTPMRFLGPKSHDGF